MCMFEFIRLLGKDSERSKWLYHKICIYIYISKFHKIHMNTKILFTDFIGQKLHVAPHCLVNSKMWHSYNIKHLCLCFMLQVPKRVIIQKIKSTIKNITISLSAQRYKLVSQCAEIQLHDVQIGWRHIYFHVVCWWRRTSTWPKITDDVCSINNCVYQNSTLLVEYIHMTRYWLAICLKAGYGIWLYQFLITAYLFTLKIPMQPIWLLRYIYRCTNEMSMGQLLCLYQIFWTRPLADRRE